MAREREILAGLKWAPFRPSSDAQLLPIRVMEIQKSIVQTEADQSLSAADKAAKLEDLNARKARYEAELASSG